MSKTIIVGSNFVRMDLLALNLKMYVGTETTVLDSVENLQTFLKLDQDIGLIIIESEINGTQAALNTTKLLKKNDLDIELCILGEKHKEINCGNILPIDVTIKELIKTVAKIYEVTALDMVKKQVGEYVSIPLAYFERVNTAMCDIFVKVEKNGKGYEYVQRFSTGKKITKQIIPV